MDERIDINGLVDELKRVDRMFDTATTDEQRVFIHMRLVNCGQALVQQSGQIANALTGKCVDRLDARVQA
jgi:hypothetical protein